MSKLYEKYIARQELIRRGVRKLQQEEENIRSLSTAELQRILDEPIEEEKSDG